MVVRTLITVGAEEPHDADHTIPDRWPARSDTQLPPARAHAW
ncbi:hypothetical protein ABZ904_39305 [Streptomyces sp. NPDC046900]